MLSPEFHFSETLKNVQGYKRTRHAKRYSRSRGGGGGGAARLFKLSPCLRHNSPVSLFRLRQNSKFSGHF